MYRLRKFLAIITLTVLIFPLFSCKEEKESGFLRSLDAPAQMVIEGERNTVAFSAVINIGDGEGKITFTAPDSMSGICVRSAGGVWNCELNGVNIAGISAEMLGAPLYPFLEIGNAFSAEKITEGERALTLIVTENGKFEYYIDSKSGFPIRLIEKNAEGATVMRFDIKDYIAK